jgi:DNA-binding CsgD family transcriptional regulator
MQEQLTQREKELLNLLLDGISPKEIAYKLHISTHTVDFHRNNLYRKLGVMSIQELFAKAQSSDGKNINLPTEEQITDDLSYNEPSEMMSSDNASSILADTQKISPDMMSLLPYSDADEGKGKSTIELSINQETIDGVLIDNVLTINANLARGYIDPFANVQVKNEQVLHLLRRADGTRFKARGDGKKWLVQFVTMEALAVNYTYYQYTVNTVRDQTIIVDIPYSILRQPDRTTEYQKIKFIKENILTVHFEIGIGLQGLGSSSIKIWDFEIY